MDLNTYLNKVGNGAAADLARKINVAPVLISQWKTGRRPIPVGHCPAIEKATDGIVRCEDLHPDVDWGYLRASRSHHVGSDSPTDQRDKSNQTI